ncbi:hypothetical protein [Pedobacter hiemivivus]|uniref:hypothetical protein n=1 Tax=Pedobacter hiemivivus TaxID=2530454 RepID=UPI0013F172D9|nr:hypothetical protein [Pedobacter hiemivivus]
MNQNLNRTKRSLAYKLQLLADGEDQELTAAEAAVYGADYADEFPEDEIREEDDHGN